MTLGTRYRTFCQVRSRQLNGAHLGGIHWIGLLISKLYLIIDHHAWSLSARRNLPVRFHLMKTNCRCPVELVNEHFLMPANYGCLWRWYERLLTSLRRIFESRWRIRYSKTDIGLTIKRTDCHSSILWLSVVINSLSTPKQFLFIKVLVIFYKRALEPTPLHFNLKTVGFE